LKLTTGGIEIDNQEEGGYFVCFYWGRSRIWFVCNISVYNRYFVFVVCANFAHW